MMKLEGRGEWCVSPAVVASEDSHARQRFGLEQPLTRTITVENIGGVLAGIRKKIENRQQDMAHLRWTQIHVGNIQVAERE